VTNARALIALLDAIRGTNGNATAGLDLVLGATPLTAARFTVLRVVVRQSAPPTVPMVARILAVSRQAVLRLVVGLAGDGIVELHPNPHHAKAPLIFITAEGRLLFEKYEARHIEWISSIAPKLTPEEVEIATRVLLRLQLLISKSNPEGDAGRPA
jgi:DNA-binding MarR family transcriptional regulator